MAIAPGTKEDYAEVIQKAVREGLLEYNRDDMVDINDLMQQMAQMALKKASEFPPEEQETYQQAVNEDLRLSTQLVLSIGEVTRDTLQKVHEASFEDPTQHPIKIVQDMIFCFGEDTSLRRIQPYESNFSHEAIIQAWKDFCHSESHYEMALPGLNWGDSPREVKNWRPGHNPSTMPTLTPDELEFLYQFFTEAMTRNHNVVVQIATHDWIIFLIKAPERKVSLRCFQVMENPEEPYLEDTNNIYFSVYHSNQWTEEQLATPDPRFLAMREQWRAENPGWDRQEGEETEGGEGVEEGEEGEVAEPDVEDELNHAGAGSRATTGGTECSEESEEPDELDEHNPGGSPETELPETTSGTGSSTDHPVPVLPTEEGSTGGSQGSEFSE